TYAGRLYLGHRDLGQFLVPLRAAIDQGVVRQRETRVHVRLLDPLPDETTAQIRFLELVDVVEIAYDVPRDEVINLERASQFLLHLRWTDVAEQGIITGKIYEYLAARRPILSTGAGRDVV